MTFMPKKYRPSATPNSDVKPVKIQAPQPDGDICVLLLR